jgi:hypothetical protein
MLGGEPFGDRPRSVCPALREFLQGYNDGLPDDLRQELFGLASDIVDTHAPPRVTAWRARLCVDWARSVAGIASISTRFKGSTLSNCARAGRYTAQVARSNPWCHSQTVAFFTWMARRSSPDSSPPRRSRRCPSARSSHAGLASRRSPSARAISGQYAPLSPASASASTVGRARPGPAAPPLSQPATLLGQPDRLGTVARIELLHHRGQVVAHRPV